MSTAASKLLVSGSTAASGARLMVTDGLLTLAGGLALSGGSVLQTRAGLTTVLGVASVDALFLFGGQSAIQVDGGTFTCVGSLNLLGGFGVADLRIGQALVNIYGLLTANPVNSTLCFISAGTLTLGGALFFPTPANFTAGSGAVIYTGIPGTAQVVAPFTYYDLVIAGVGGGRKTVSDPVRVQHALTLLLDTLILESAGSLQLDDNVLLTRAAGKLRGTPVFAGHIDLTYANLAHDTTGAELPTNPATLRNLTVSALGGVLLGADATLSGQLTLALGSLSTGPHSLWLTNPTGGLAGTDPAISRAAGYVEGRLTRTIGTGIGTRRFPFGSQLGNRELALTYDTAPAAAGTLTVVHEPTPPGATGLPLAETGVTVTTPAPFYWQATAGGGLAGGSFNLALTAEGLPAGATQLLASYRPTAADPWILAGTAGPLAGSPTSPVVEREQLTALGQFTIDYNSAAPLPVQLTAFTGLMRDGCVHLNWTTASEVNSAYFAVERQQANSAFTEVGRVGAAGTTSQPQVYTWPDETPAPGLNYYRLRQVDMNGMVTYSPVVVVSVARLAPDNFVLFPSPTTGLLIIRSTYSTPTAWLVRNVVGQAVGMLHLGSNDVSALPAGIYFVEGPQQIHRFVKQ